MVIVLGSLCLEVGLVISLAFLETKLWRGSLLHRLLRETECTFFDPLFSRPGNQSFQQNSKNDFLSV